MKEIRVMILKISRETPFAVVMNVTKRIFRHSYGVDGEGFTACIVDVCLGFL
jgi:hypothetical protein